MFFDVPIFVSDNEELLLVASLRQHKMGLCDSTPWIEQYTAE